jgi:hypothetical protein
VGAQVPETADLDLARVARPAPAVAADPDGLDVVVLVAMGHAGKFGGDFSFISVRGEISDAFRAAEAA